MIIGLVTKQSHTETLILLGMGMRLPSILVIIFYVFLREATALVSPVKIKKSDINTGTIIVGGRIAPKYQHFEDSYQRRLDTNNINLGF